MKTEKITIYTVSEFMGSVIVREGSLIETGVERYAQYDRAPFVSFVPKGKRNGYKIRGTYKPYILVLRGHGHPQPADFLNAGVTDENGTTIRESRYPSFDDRYKTDFDNMMREYLKTHSPLMDVRHTQGTEIIPQEVTA